MFKRSQIKIMIFSLIFFLMMLSSVRISKAYTQIEPGSYYIISSTPNCNYVYASWSMSAFPIDIFLLTQSQYDNWSGSYELPSESEFMCLGNTDYGSFELNLNESEKYYAVFSYIRGETAISAYVDIEVNFMHKEDIGIDSFFLFSIIGIILAAFLRKSKFPYKNY